MDETFWGRGEKVLANDDGSLIYCHYCPCTYVIVYVCTIMEITDNRDPDHPVTGRVVMPLADTWPAPDDMGFYGLQVVPYDTQHGKVQLGGQWWELGAEYNALYEMGLANCRNGWNCVAGKISVVARCADDETPKQFCSAAKAQAFINSHTSLYWFCRISKHGCNCCYAMSGGWIGSSADGVMYDFDIVQTVHYTEDVTMLRVESVNDSLDVHMDTSGLSDYDKQETHVNVSGEITLSGMGRAYRNNVYPPYGTGLTIDIATAQNLEKSSQYLNTDVTPYDYASSGAYTSSNGSVHRYGETCIQTFKTLNHSQNFYPARIAMSALCFDNSESKESLNVGASNVNNPRDADSVWWGDFYSDLAVYGFDTGLLTVSRSTEGAFDTPDFGSIGISNMPFSALTPNYWEYGSPEWYDYGDGGDRHKYWNYTFKSGEYAESFDAKPDLDIYMITGTQKRHRDWQATYIEFEVEGTDSSPGGISGYTIKTEYKYHLIVDDTIVLTAADPCDNTDADPQIQSVFASLPDDLRQSRVYEKSSQESK